MTLARYFEVKKVNKASSAFVKELDLYQGDIVGVYLEVENKRVGDRNHASEILMRNWRNQYFKRTTLNLFAKFIDSDAIEYVERETLI